MSSQRADIKGSALASYLLFEAPYTRELMQRGCDDAQRLRAEAVAFFDWTDLQAEKPTEHVRPPLIECHQDPLRVR